MPEAPEAPQKKREI